MSSKFEIKEYKSEYDNLIYRVLDRSGIKDIDLFLSQPMKQSFKTDDYIIDLDKGIDLLDKKVKNGAKIGLLVDPDVDGFTSSAIFLQFMEEIHPNSCIKVEFHTKHGLSQNNIINRFIQSDIELLILPDSSSNDFKEQLILKEHGIDTIIIDHHIIEKENEIPESSIIINNQREGQNINKNLTGVGMVLKFIYYYYKKIGKEDEFFNNNNYFNLAAVGQIGDSSDLSDIEIRSIVLKGLNNMENSLFLKILREIKGHVLDSKYDGLTFIDISYSICPLVNAIARIGDEEDMLDMFNSIWRTGKEDEKQVVVRKRKNAKTKKFEDKELLWNIYDITFENMNKIKRQQDNIVKKLEKEIKDDLSINGEVAIALTRELTDKEKSVVGLTANKISDFVRKPTLILRDNNGNWSGSGRNYKNYFKSFKNWCQNTKLVEFAQGHHSAFGISIPEDNLEKFISKTFQIESEKESNIYNVDRLTNSIDKNSVLEGYLARFVTGGQVDDILYGFKNIQINTKFIKMRANTATIWENGVEFMIFNEYLDVIQEILDSGEMFINLDIIGSPNIKPWGKQEMQIMVRDIQIGGRSV